MPAVMIHDLPNNGKKCGGTESNDRTSDLRNAEAQENECKDNCAKDPDCVAMSGIWGEWCIGCKVALSSLHPGAKAFKKGI